MQINYLSLERNIKLIVLICDGISGFTNPTPLKKNLVLEIRANPRTAAETLL